MSPFARRWLTVLLGLAGGGLLVFGAVVSWLLRDPLPRMAERRSTLAAVAEGREQRSDGMVSVSARLRASSGLEVDVVVRTPEPPAEADPAAASGEADAPAAPDDLVQRPLFLLLGGYRTGERAAMLIEETRGAVVAAMGYPYDGPVDLSGLSVLRHLPEIRRAILDTPPAIQLVLDYLLERPEIDPARVELVGVSFGAFFAPAGAALDPRVTRLWLIHGAARPRAVLEHGLARYVRWCVPRKVIAAAANVAFAGPQLAPERWLPRVSPRPVVMISAADDESLPQDAVEALHASAREPKEQIRLPGRHVHPAREDVIRQLMDVVLERAAEDVGGP